MGNRIILVITMSGRPGFLLSENGQILSEFEGKRNDSSGWFVALERELKRHGLSVPEINDVILDAGPGSFTGLRISFAAVKVWGFLFPALRVYSIPNLLLWAEPDNVVVRDAGRGNVYALEWNQGKAELSLWPKTRLERVRKRIIWASEPSPRDFLQYFHGHKSELSPESLEGLLPVYLYPDDCSVQRT